eukprot:m51a1_g9109 hypothetical protein (236) ;mRNA; r:110083-110863
MGRWAAVAAVAVALLLSPRALGLPSDPRPSTVYELVPAGSPSCFEEPVQPGDLVHVLWRCPTCTSVHVWSAGPDSRPLVDRTLGPSGRVALTALVRGPHVVCLVPTTPTGSRISTLYAATSTGNAGDAQDAATRRRVEGAAASAAAASSRALRDAATRRRVEGAAASAAAASSRALRVREAFAGARSSSDEAVARAVDAGRALWCVAGVEVAVAVASAAWAARRAVRCLRRSKAV